MKKNCKDLSLKKLNKRENKKIIINQEILSKIELLKRLASNQDNSCWQIGDLCIELLDKYRMPLGIIAKSINYTMARVSHFHLTARCFTDEHRQGFTFQDSLTARQVFITMPRLDMSVLQIREIISNLENRTACSIRAHFVKILIEKESNKALDDASKVQLNNFGIINNTHNADWRDIIPKLPDNSVKLFIADPPFGGFEKGENGRYYCYAAPTSGMRTECDNETTDEALDATLPLFELCYPKMAKEGVMLLFQPGGKADRIEVLKKADEFGWRCEYSLTWNKGLKAVGNKKSPYRIATEKILVFIRKDDTFLKQQSGTYTGDVLDFRTETINATTRMDYGKIEYHDFHIFQKPSALIDLLIRNHTYPGDLVVEPFGCSGSGVISAINNGRQWVYIESNQTNYNWAKNKIRKILNQKMQNAI